MDKPSKILYNGDEEWHITDQNKIVILRKDNDNQTTEYVKDEVFRYEIFGKKQTIEDEAEDEDDEDENQFYFRRVDGFCEMIRLFPMKGSVKYVGDIKTNPKYDDYSEWELVDLVKLRTWRSR